MPTIAQDRPQPAPGQDKPVVVALKGATKVPVVAFDTDPQENAALADGSIDALVVQNPYFFGYQGVVEAGMASVGSQPPPKLDPGAVVATTKNANDPTVKPLLNPPTAKAS
jgi:ribose transport system substrate-binding protein